MSAALLKLDGVTVRFGGLTAVNAIDLAVGDRELVGLIGPNGAGKTTVFNVITGVYRPTDGTVSFDGRQIDRLPPHRIARRGIARTFQNIRLFSGLTVFENVRAALVARIRPSPFHALVRASRWRREESDLDSQAEGLLRALGLEHRRDREATSLPYGEQRRLEIARALATQPRLLLLDEPAAGMNPTEKAALIELIRDIRSRFGVGILLVEHSMRVVMDVCERIAVLDYGQKIAEGTPAEIRSHPKVIEAYLGDGAAQL